MQLRKALTGFGVLAISIASLATRAQAISIEDARTAVDAILMQSGISATEVDARTIDGNAVELVYDAISLDLNGYSTPRQLVMDDVLVSVRDTDNSDQVDLDVKLPEQARMLAEATSDQRELTLRNAGGYLRWDTARNVPVTFDGFADFLVGEEPVSRKHWMMNGLIIQWLPEMARIAWQAAEWTGPNREKRGSIKSTNFTLYPGEDGNTRLDYAHDGLWLPSLLQPRTVRVKTSSDGLPWSDAQPIIEKGFHDILTGTAPRFARRQIGDALWKKAAQNGAPVKVDEFYVESRGLEALGSGEFLAQAAARYGFTGDFDFRLLGQDKLVDLLGTPDSPTLLGALVPFAVNGLAAGRPGPQGTTEYDGQLLPDGRVVVNGLTVFRTADGS
ncbi:MULTISPECIES: hypothetical protein [Thalassospira]|uniref:Uncharacterized protein n=1 Tax=Thalassospira profundimaris TaxID=502049 RepID=A0A367V8M4_9PROT|nr:MULTISPECIES: hypothetical protein [Thalassospira]KZB72371.1 hypothetical protein AUQ43_04485 [Thalassospira sp. MCCC 1A01148]RCK21578.1 hypothetical protein TH6_13380 [Thalassospira profundimaris]